LGVGGILIVAVLAIVIGSRISESSRTTEAYDLSLAKMAYGSDNIAVARSQFENVAQKYSGSAAAEAHYYLGRIASESEQYDDADEHFNQALGAGDENIVIGAMAGLATSMEARKQYAAAAEKYEEIARKYPDAGFAPEALSQAARLYFKANQTDDQKRALEMIVSDYDKSSAYPKAKRDLDQLK
jgi:TolA-binding protein